MLLEPSTQSVHLELECSVKLSSSLWSICFVGVLGEEVCSIKESIDCINVSIYVFHNLWLFGALLLMDDSDSCLSMKDVYMKISDVKSGCCWEYFEAYMQLKSLGYMVGRHNVPLSLKSVNCHNGSISPHCSSRNREVDVKSKDKMPIIGIFDVYLSNNKFRKSFLGDPSFVLGFTSHFHLYSTHISFLL
ncbi:hypothetical protein UlMin_015909 [Ulmus minor]